MGLLTVAENRQVYFEDHGGRGLPVLLAVCAIPQTEAMNAWMWSIFMQRPPAADRAPFIEDGPRYREVVLKFLKSLWCDFRNPPRPAVPFERPYAFCDDAYTPAPLVLAGAIGPGTR